MPRLSYSLSLAALLLAAAPAPAGSLWIRETNNESGLFADRRAKRLGDILTIVVQEDVSAVNTTDVKSSRNNASAPGLVTNLVNQFLGGLPARLLSAKSALPTLPPGALPAALGKAGAPGVKLPTLATDGKDEYHYGGTATSQQTLSTRAAVTVVDVLPNGNLVLEGTRAVAGNREKVCAYLRGIVRAADVQKDNTVISTNIADLELQFLPEGSLSEVRKGWLQRLNDRVRPF